MKKLFGFFLIILAGCGSAEVVTTEPEPTVTDEAEVETVPANPFIVEDLRIPLNGMPIHLELLPTGKWMVGTREGHFYLLEADFTGIAKHSIAVETFADSALVSVVADPDYISNRYVYIFYTMLDSAPPCDVGYCNTVVRYTVDEAATFPLSNPTTIALFPMPNRIGQHHGGGMAFGPDGMLYVGLGDGQFFGTLEELLANDQAQNPDSNFGKVLRINPVTTESEVAALGVRNPFTMVSTPAGAVVGDVGWENSEEANLVVWDSDPINFGWPLTEGPFDQDLHPDFTQPLQFFHHCDEKFKDDDAFEHSTDDEAKALSKNHNGVVHPCGNEVIAVLAYYPARSLGDPDPYNGALDGAVIYSEIYYGWIRSFQIDDGAAVGDRNIAHQQGLTSIAEGPDGYLYGVSIFPGENGSNLFKLIPNN